MDLVSFFAKNDRFYDWDIRKYAHKPNHFFLLIIGLNNIILCIKSAYPEGASDIQYINTNDVNLKKGLYFLMNF